MVEKEDDAVGIDSSGMRTGKTALELKCPKFHREVALQAFEVGFKMPQDKRSHHIFGQERFLWRESRPCFFE